MEPVAGEHAVPHAAPFLESMRGVGYSLESSIADLINNNISAGSRNVWLDFRWAGSTSIAIIADDGCGMSEAGLVEAMRPGTEGPLAIRGARDLGRFGLGLKTASLSQCRQFTVATKRQGEDAVSVRSWDLDFVATVKDWILRRDVSPASEESVKLLAPMASGTVITWERMDRVVGYEQDNNRQAEEHYLRRVESVRNHLAMVFHRYLEDTSEGVRVYLNGHEERHRIRPWNPFLVSKSESTPVERIPCHGTHVYLQGHVLPHRDRLSDKEYDLGGGPAGWNAQQGFYVYRNRRMLVSGGWLGLGESRPWTQEEYYKLARISVDFTNDLDSQWHIDIKKSVAFPPRAIRDRMIQLAREVRETSRRIYAHRGRAQTIRGGGAEDIRIWAVRETGAGPRYRVNRNHPLLVELFGSQEARSLSEQVLKLIEMSVPIQRIWLDAAESGDKPVSEQDLLPVSEVLPIALKLVAALTDSAGMSQDAARRTVLATEPFASYPALTELLRT